MGVLGRRRWVVLGVVLGAAGCVEPPASLEASSDATEAATSGTTNESSGNGTSGSDETAGSTSTSDGGLDEGPWCSVPGRDDRLAHCSSDGGGVAFECDLVAQDCPRGEKCVPWANDGGAAWNASRCSPVPRVPDPVGAPCTVEANAASGLDSCELGAMCWDVDPVTLEGVCVSMCTGAAPNPSCEGSEARCLVANEGAIVLCVPTCDPLLQDCDRGDPCVRGPNDEGWICVPGLGEPEADGSRCEYLNVCAVGSVCASAWAVPGCGEAWACCTPLCDVGGEACPIAGTECVPWYEPGRQPPGLETLGLCSSVSEPPAVGWSPTELVSADFG